MKKKQPPALRVLVCTPVYGDTVKRGYSHSVAQAMAFFAQADSDVPKMIDIQMAYLKSGREQAHSG